MDISLPGSGLFWPVPPRTATSQGVLTIDATGEKIAFIGRLNIEGGASGKTLDTSGASAIGLQLGGRTWNTAGSQIKIGFQGLDAAGGTPARPDGTYVGASVTLDQGTDALTSNVWHSWTPDAGSSSFSHGDLVVMVIEFVTRNGSDSVSINTLSANGIGSQFPVGNHYIGGAWLATGNGGYAPSVVLTFSDGTIGMFDGIGQVGAAVPVTWDDNDNPDERGIIFQVPFDCEIDAFFSPLRIATNASALDFYFGDSPTSGRNNILGPIAYSAKSLQIINSETILFHTLATPQALTADTDYFLSLKAASTGSDDVRFTQLVVGDANHRKLITPAGSTLRGITANNLSDFTASDTTFPPMGVRISKIKGFGELSPTLLLGI